MRAATLVAVLTLAGIVFTLQAQDQPQKAAPPSTRKTEQASNVKTKETHKMKCCTGDSTSCMKGGKSCCGEMKKR